jgi:very-short-patch-repair endonuclease
MILLLVALVLALIAVGVVSVLAKSRGSSDTGPWPYYAKRPLSAVEQVLYFRLVKALPERIVLAQVGLSRLLGVKKGNNFAAWNNRINRMSVDFVICAKDATILAVIELDDASHARDDRQAADGKKDRALQAAGLRIIRLQAKSLPDEAAIQALLEGPGAPADATRRLDIGQAS